MLAIDSTHDQAFLADLHAARLHALGVLRSILNFATLTPEARAEFLKSGRTALALLRESRLAAAQILNLQLPLPEGGGRGVGSSNARSPHTPNTQPRATPSPRDHQPPPQPTPTANPPASHLHTPPRQPVPQHPFTPPNAHNTPLLRHAIPTLANQLRTRAGAAP